MFGLVVLVLIALALVLTFFAVESARREREAKADAIASRVRALSGLDGFNPGIVFEGLPGASSVAIDPASNQFAIVYADNRPRLFGFDQLIAVEVERDGQTITKTTGRVDAKGAALATLLAGPVGGLLVGAKTSSTSSSTTMVTKLALKLYLNDLHVPVVMVPFSNGGHEWQVAADVEKLDAWHGRFRTIVAGNEHTRDTSRVARTTFAIAGEPLPSNDAPQLGWWSRTFGG